MLVSFIIPHKGREELLAQTLHSILNQKTQDIDIEIIVITQNKVLECVENTGRFSSINVYLRDEQETISALRNYGVSKSNGQYLAFLDADIGLSDNWLMAMLNNIQANTDRVLVSAMQINSENAPPLERIRTALSNAEVDCNVNFLPGRNLFLSREIFNKVNGFPEHLVTCEDYYFTDKVHEHGLLFYTSDATYVHLGEDKIYEEMFKKEIWRGQSNLQSIRGRKIPLREIPSITLPILLFILMLLLVLSLTIQQQVLATLCAVSIILPILAYSFRLYKLADGTASFKEILKFYLLYFPARAIGTLGGVFKAISTNSHK